MPRDDPRRVHSEILDGIFSSLHGVKVRVWSRFKEEPVEGLFVYLSTTSPFILLIKDRSGFYRVINWKDVTEMQVLTKHRIPEEVMDKIKGVGRAR